MSNLPLKVAFDVDGTLIDYGGKPRYEIISLFHILEKLGCDMFIWSGGGPDYATAIKNKLGLTAAVRVKGSFTPDLAIDDQDADLGTLTFKVPAP